MAGVSDRYQTDNSFITMILWVTVYLALSFGITIDGQIYDASTEICCRTGLVAEKPLGYNPSTYDCCGDRCYNKNGEVCCDNKTVIVLPRNRTRGDFVYQCCGKNIFPVYTKRDLREDVKKCCNNQLYSAKTHICCSNKLYRIDAHYSITQCCGDRTYDVTTSVCCQNKIYKSHSNRECCGSSYIDKSTQKCCFKNPGNEAYPANKRPYNYQKQQNEYYERCCGDSVYFYTTEICCDGNTYENPQLNGQQFQCCGKHLMNNNNQMCCDNREPHIKLYPLEICCGHFGVSSDEYQCCGGTPYRHKGTERCCENKLVYNHTTQTCFCNRVLNTDFYYSEVYGKKSCCVKS